MEECGARWWVASCVDLHETGCRASERGIPMLRPTFEPLEGRVLFATILFVRGGHASGGFLEATDPADRNLELADIADASTAVNNTGWGTLAQALRDEGFTVEQFNEAKGLPGPFDGF